MLFQISGEFDWILGLGLALIIAITFTFINYQTREGEGTGLVFFTFLNIGLAISAYAGLVDLWYFVLSSIFLIIVLIYTVSTRSSGV